MGHLFREGLIRLRTSYTRKKVGSSCLRDCRAGFFFFLFNHFCIHLLDSFEDCLMCCDPLKKFPVPQLLCDSLELPADQTVKCGCL